MKKMRVTIEGKAYEVLVEVLEDSGGSMPAAPAPSAPTAVPPAASKPEVTASASAPKSSSGNAGDVPCPLTGKIVSIDVKVGDMVKEGAQVATVEAMKMNTYIYAPRSGRVAAILVNPGQGVEEGAPLLSIA